MSISEPVHKDSLIIFPSERIVRMQIGVSSTISDGWIQLLAGFDMLRCMPTLAMLVVGVHRDSKR
jgi:hypothetical protein